MTSAADSVASAPSAVAPEIFVALDAVTFGYDKRTVLDGISMRIPRGKVVAIMGGSGCGKTTILRLIGGQLAPRSGSSTECSRGYRLSAAAASLAPW